MAKKQKPPPPPWEKKNRPVYSDATESEVTQITYRNDLVPEMDALESNDPRVNSGDAASDERLFRRALIPWYRRTKILGIIGGGILFVMIILMFFIFSGEKKSEAPPEARTETPLTLETSSPVTPVTGQTPVALPTPRTVLTTPSISPAPKAPTPQYSPKVQTPAIRNPAPEKPRKSVTKASAPAVKVVPRNKPAFLNIEAQPWAIVYIDDKRLNRITPIRALELPPGRYRLRLENPQTKKRLEKEVRLKAGQSLSLTFQLR